MRYLQALAVAVFAATLVMAAGCEPDKTTSGANQAGRATAAQLQKELDQVKQDLQAAQSELATIRNELAMKTTEIQNLQKQLDAANAKIAEVTKTVREAMKLAAPPVAPPPSPE